MSDAARAESEEEFRLDRIKVLQVDAQPQSRGILSQMLLQVGLTGVDTTISLDDFRQKLVEIEPDLLFIDLDDNQPDAIEVIREIRAGQLGKDPDAVVVALTHRPKLATVRAAHQAGVDALLLKPVTEESLRAQVFHMIEDPASKGAAARERRGDDDEVCRATLRELSIQKFFHLANDIRRSAEKLREMLIKNPDRPLPDGALEHIVAALDEIEDVVADQQFGSILRIVATTRRALEEVVAGRRRPKVELFDLLLLQGFSITAVLRESEAPAGDLIAALDKAAGIVAGRGEAIAGGEEADEPGESAPAEAAPDDAGETPREAADEAGPERPSLGVRLRAWWDGVEPEDVIARRDAD